MGTRFKTLLAPIGRSTGDGRRFADDAITLAPVPFPIMWVRESEGGHDGAVAVGAVQEARTGTVAEALANGWISPEKVEGLDAGMRGVWASGEFFDAVDREKLPRLAEDVATAMHLIENGTLGPSVDLDSFEGAPVLAGTDDPLTEAAYAAAFEATGTEPKVELLITAGRVRAATLVSIPAFVETPRPLELVADVAETDEALVASVGTEARGRAAAFDGVALDRPTPITYDYETGRVFGHIALWKTCHAGYSGVCVTPPRGADGYAAFNRFPVETEDGVVWAGRITAGGRHAGLSLAADATMREYDKKATVAWVRAYEDEHGIAVAGALVADLSEGDKAILSRRKVSGDWRETSAGLSLVEVLALSPGPRAHSEPGFPVETFSSNGRQVALVASWGVEPEEAPDVRALVAEELARRDAAAALSLALRQETDARRGALLAALSEGA